MKRKYVKRPEGTPVPTRQERSAASYADPEGRERQKAHVAKYQRTEKGKATAIRASAKYRQTEIGKEKTRIQTRKQNAKRKAEKLALAALELETGDKT